MASIASDGENDVFVLSLIREETLEAVGELQEVLVLCHSRLQETGFNVDIGKHGRGSHIDLPISRRELS